MKTALKGFFKIRDLARYMSGMVQSSASVSPYIAPDREEEVIVQRNIDSSYRENILTFSRERNLHKQIELLSGPGEISELLQSERDLDSQSYLANSALLFIFKKIQESDSRRKNMSASEYRDYEEMVDCQMALIPTLLENGASIRYIMNVKIPSDFIGNIENFRSDVATTITRTINIALEILDNTELNRQMESIRRELTPNNIENAQNTDTPKSKKEEKIEIDELAYDNLRGRILMLLHEDRGLMVQMSIIETEEQYHCLVSEISDRLSSRELTQIQNQRYIQEQLDMMTYQQIRSLRDLTISVFVQNLPHSNNWHRLGIIPEDEVSESSAKEEKLLSSSFSSDETFVTQVTSFTSGNSSNQDSTTTLGELTTASLPFLGAGSFSPQLSLESISYPN